MHDLLQEMGKDIVRQESKDPTQRTRLWDSKDIHQVLTQTNEAHPVESISLDMSEIRDIDLNSSTFTRMPNLKFLKFYFFNEKERTEGRSKLQLSQGLNYLPNEMRYLQWDGYPLESLPVNFHPRNLLVLKLRNSKIKQLWKEAKDNSRLKLISQSIRESQIFNLGSRILRSCTSLVKIPLPVSHLNNVTSIALWNCQSIRSLPSHVDLETLEILDISHCPNLKQFPQISSSIRYLYLDGTAINEVPSTVERLGNLLELSMTSCQLATLPSNICRLSSLQSLNLSGCGKLKQFPEILEPMENLKELKLCETGIEELPSSFGNLTGLATLRICCAKLNHLPSCLTSLNSLNCLMLSMEKGPEFSMPPSSFEAFSSLNFLSLTHCNLWKLPEDLSFLCSVEALVLEENHIEEIPSSIKQLSQLRFLNVSNCLRLQSLAELPANLAVLVANNCRSLKTISALRQLIYEFKGLCYFFFMYDCLMLAENECEAIINEVFRSRDHKGNICLPVLRILSESVARFPYLVMVYAASRIPDCFLYQCRGDSIKVHLPSDWLNSSFLGFALCIHYQTFLPLRNVRYKCYFGDRNDQYANTVFNEFFIPNSDSGKDKHVCLWFGYELFDWICKNRELLCQTCYNEVSFVFHQEIFEVKNCGIIPLYGSRSDKAVEQKNRVLEVQRQREDFCNDQAHNGLKEIDDITESPFS